MHGLFSLGRAGRGSSGGRGGSTTNPADDGPGSPSAGGGGGGAEGGGSRGSGAGRGSSQGRRGRQRRRAAEDDPLGLDGELFEYVSHRMHHGEAFVAYRLLGRPMVLHSVEDGLPLASLHLRVVNRTPAQARQRQGNGSPPAPEPAQALLARRPDRGDSEFLGIINADNQEFELVMTNLTSSDVLMFDIGGNGRAREDEFWERTEASFWSGRHRNDRRLNRSNILWPMKPNRCSENHLYFQDHQEHRRLVLRARPDAPAAGGAGGADQADELTGFPIYVYPKYGSRTVQRFARTSWSCPENMLVIGTPALLEGDVHAGHNIQIERPRAAGGQAAPAPGSRDAVGIAASSLGVSRERLLQVLGLDDQFLRDMAPAMQHELLRAAFHSADLSALEDEPPPESIQQAASQQSLSSSPGRLAMGARPADVAAGRRLLGAGAPHGLLIEKFDFEQRGAEAILSLGVRDSMQMVDGGEKPMEPEEEALLLKRLEQLVETRNAELMEDARSKAIYSTPECVVCMESSPPPDIVLYQCGHRCVHLQCVESVGLRRCPLCRSPIVALLPAPAETATTSSSTVVGI